MTTKTTQPVKQKKPRQQPQANNKTRCRWVSLNKPHYVEYHDKEWGVPVHDDRLLFEMLILEGAQAGLSWEIILKRREGYKKAFRNFEPKSVAAFKDNELDNLMNNDGIIKNRAKIYSARQNAKVFMDIQEEFGSFDKYVWGFVNNKPIVRRPKEKKDFLASSKESDALSKDLKKRGMNFVGSTIIYAYMQGIGMVDDHMKDCWKAKQTNPSQA